MTLQRFRVAAVQMVSAPEGLTHWPLM